MSSDVNFDLLTEEQLDDLLDEMAISVCTSVTFGGSIGRQRMLNAVQRINFRCKHQHVNLNFRYGSKFLTLEQDMVHVDAFVDVVQEALHSVTGQKVHRSFYHHGSQKLLYTLWSRMEVPRKVLTARRLGYVVAIKYTWFLKSKGMLGA